LLNAIPSLILVLFLGFGATIIKPINTVKRISTLFILFITYLGSFAQSKPEGFHIDKPIDVAAILATKQPSLALGFSSVSEARSIINDIMNVVSQQQNFKVVSTGEVENAAAVVHQGQRYILYNPTFISQLDNVAKDKWASISVVAHEIGHHLLGHTLDGRGSQLPKELGADEFSGAVLHKMGASLQQAQLAMQLISSPYASATHPGQRDRLIAIAKGWNSTSNVSNNDSDVAVGYPENRSSYPSNDRRSNYPTEEIRGRNNTGTYGRNGNYPSQREYPTQRQTYPSQRGRRNVSNNIQTIVYDVKFKRSNGDQYYITNQNNVVKYNGRVLSTVAKMVSINNAYYPYVMYDDQVQLFVNKKGSIVNDRGQTVGYITYH
jgi:hypothetical protein